MCGRAQTHMVLSIAWDKKRFSENVEWFRCDTEAPVNQSARMSNTVRDDVIARDAELFSSRLTTGNANREDVAD